MGKRQVLLTYHKAGTQPPVFVAGTFSDPAWQPFEMSNSADQGEYTFEEVISVDAGTEVQYKFRLGTGDWWACDDAARKVTDSQGNLNNVLRISPLSIDEGDFDDDDEDESSEDAGPMFSHECFENYDISPTTSNSPDEEVTNGSEPAFRFSNTTKPTLDTNTGNGEIDYNDPRLERFPHQDRRSIIAELQRIETSTEPDRSLPEGIPPPSPIVSPTWSSSPAILEPEPSPRRSNAPRASLGSFHSERSHVSLASIDETVEEEVEGSRANGQDHTNVPPPGTYDAADYKAVGGSRGSAAPAVPQIEPTPPIVRLEAPSDDEDEGVSLSTGNSIKTPESNQLRKRETKTAIQRTLSSTATDSFHEISKQDDWFRSLFRALFASIGHIFSNILFGNRRKA
ncbi:hypothetical protein SUNI508_08466 [Seiridium unicorne]|uniref:AMP-activated protein kinase glycogen-binding domain-containing protein n=1 Tax=Seiridium unicorne TaxID=138068 RepID=A0ABR2UTT5_9PEZI